MFIVFNIQDFYVHLKVFYVSVITLNDFLIFILQLFVANIWKCIYV
jgi:hypothetical protein